MEFPIKFDTATCKPGWSIVNIARSLVIFLSVKMDFALANSVYPNKKQHYVAFYLGFRCLPKYLLWGLWYPRVMPNNWPFISSFAT